MKKILVIATALTLLSACTTSTKQTEQVIPYKAFVLGDAANSVAVFRITESNDGAITQPVTIYVDKLPYEATFDICQLKAATNPDLANANLVCPSTVTINVTESPVAKLAHVDYYINTLNSYKLQHTGKHVDILPGIRTHRSNPTAPSYQIKPDGKVFLGYSYEKDTVIQTDLEFK